MFSATLNVTQLRRHLKKHSNIRQVGNFPVLFTKKTISAKMKEEARYQAYLFASKANIPITSLAKDPHKNWMIFVSQFFGCPATDINHLCPSKFILKETGRKASEEMKEKIKKIGGVLAEQGRLRFDIK